MRNQSLDELLMEMEEVDKKRQDLNVPLYSLVMQDDGKLKSHTYGEFEPSDNAIDKMCSLYGLSMPHLNILKSQDRMDLVAETFNHFLLKDNQIMKLRIVDDNRLKGIVDKHYKKFDDYQLFMMIGEYLNQHGYDYSLEVLNKDDEFTRIRFMVSDMQENMGMSVETESDQDIIKGGFEVTNSEIGSKMGINSLLYRQICTNGMMASIDDTDNNEIFYKRGKNFNPFSRQGMINRGLNNTFEQANRTIKALRKTKDIVIDNPIEEYEKINDQYRIGKKHLDGMKSEYKHENQENLFGVVNGITRYGRNFKKDYKNRARFEFIANDIVESVNRD